MLGVVYRLLDSLVDTRASAVDFCGEVGKNLLSLLGKILSGGRGVRRIDVGNLSAGNIPDGSF